MQQTRSSPVPPGVDLTERQPGDDAPPAQRRRERCGAAGCAQHEFPEKRRRGVGKREPVDGGEQIGQVMGALRAHVGDSAHAARAHVRHVHRGGESDQRVVGADVGGGVLATDVLLSRLQGQRVRAPLVVVERHPDQAAGDASHLRLRNRHEADMRAAERCRDAERLAVTDSDVEAALAGGRQHRAGVEVGGADGEGAGVMSRLREWREVLNRPRETWVLDQERGMLRGQRRAYRLELEHSVAGRDHVDGDATPLAEGSQHGDRLRVDGAGDRDARSTGRLDGDDHRLRGGGRAVVQRRVGDVEPGQRADHRLELEDGLQRPLRGLGLVGRVRGVELRTRDGPPHDRGAEPAIDAGAEEAVVRAQRSVPGGEALELRHQVLLGEGRREVDLRVAQGGRNRGEQVRLRRRPHRIEHLATFGIGVGEIRHPQSMPGNASRPGGGPPGATG